MATAIKVRLISTTHGKQMSWAHDKSPEVALCIPHKNDVSFDWSVRLSALNLPNHFIASDSTAAIDLARNHTIDKALSVNPNWILFLDTDVLPPRNVYHMLREHELDVVSGMYFVQKDILHPAMWNLDDTDSLSPVVQWPENGIVDVDAVGLGCLLVSHKVFKEINRPFTKWTQGFERHEWDKGRRGEDKGLGEDFYFCHKIKEAGYSIYVDTSVQCLHENKGALYKGQLMSMSDTDVNKEDSEVF